MMATMTPFQKAFREAKREGRKTFTFNGKPYSTRTAEEQGREIGAKAAAGSGRGMAAGRTASDKDTPAPQREKTAPSASRADIPKDTVKAPAASTERRMSPMEMGLLTTAGALGAPLAVRGAMKVAPKVAEMASKAAPKVAGMASKAGEAVKGAASKASEAVKGAMERRAAAKTVPERKEPVYDIPPVPPKHSSLRSRIAEREANKMDGGSTKAYAKGGSVKGGGCETRGKKARYI